MKKTIGLFLILVSAGSLQAQRWGYGPGWGNGPGWGSPIKIISASYGANCNSGLVGNMTDLFQDICSGQGQVCQYIIDPNDLGDPYYGCGKDLEVIYQCRNGKLKKEHITHDVTRKFLQLRCFQN